MTPNINGKTEIFISRSQRSGAGAFRHTHRPGRTGLKKDMPPLNLRALGRIAGAARRREFVQLAPPRTQQQQARQHHPSVRRHFGSCWGTCMCPEVCSTEGRPAAAAPGQRGSRRLLLCLAQHPTHNLPLPFSLRAVLSACF